MGVLDQTVTLASGVRISGVMPVSPNASGSELSMVVLQTPPATSSRDQAIASWKKVAKSMANGSDIPAGCHSTRALGVAIPRSHLWKRPQRTAG